MELDDGLGRCDALVGDYVLACVIAFLWAGPEEETMKESQGNQLSRGLEKGYVRIAVVWPYAQFSCLQTWFVSGY
jgi:hypothetical protein